MDIQQVRYKLEQRKGQRDNILFQIRSVEVRIGQLSLLVKHCQKAQVIIQTIAKQTQQELEYHIGELVTLALSSIPFPEKYTFELEFVLRRGKTEVDLHFVRNENRINPIRGSGGGAVDIASFALRLALWSLKTPKARNVLILDEPFKFLSNDLQPKASTLLKTLSEKLGLQIILVTHNSSLVEAADKVFEVKLIKGASQVKEINQ